MGNWGGINKQRRRSMETLQMILTMKRKGNRFIKEPSDQCMRFLLWNCPCWMNWRGMSLIKLIILKNGDRGWSPEIFLLCRQLYALCDFLCLMEISASYYSKLIFCPPLLVYDHYGNRNSASFQNKSNQTIISPKTPILSIDCIKCCESTFTDIHCVHSLTVSDANKTTTRSTLSLIASQCVQCRLDRYIHGAATNRRCLQDGKHWSTNAHSAKAQRFYSHLYLLKTSSAAIQRKLDSLSFTSDRHTWVSDEHLSASLHIFSWRLQKPPRESLMDRRRGVLIGFAHQHIELCVCLNNRILNYGFGSSLSSGVF